MIDYVAFILMWWLYSQNVIRMFTFVFISFLKKIGIQKTYIIYFVVMLVSFYFLWQFKYLFFIRVFNQPILIFSGLVFLILGLFFWIWSIKTLSLNVVCCIYDIKNERFKLRTEGPYSVVRHPSYLGEWIMNIGIMLITGYYVFIIFLFLWPFLAWLITKYEEKLLVKRFGKKYESYKKYVPRLFPSIKS